MRARDAERYRTVPYYIQLNMYVCMYAYMYPETYVRVRNDERSRANRSQRKAREGGSVDGTETGA